jgi:hypothetical protein
MLHTPSFPIRAQARVAAGSRPRSPWWQQCVQLIARSPRRAGAALLRFRVWGTPALFQFERQGPVQRQLGPGLSRDSDAFWAVSEWWI